MTVTQTEMIKKALLAVELSEIKYMEKLPDASLDFSEMYKTKISRLINSERKREASLLRLSARKRLTILVASILILLLTLTACIFKDHIKEFIIESYGAMTRFFSPYDESISDYQKHTFTYIPEGYKLTESFEFQNYIEYRYSNSTHFISITQSQLSGNSIQIDTENASYDILNINNIEVHRSIKNNTYMVVWKTDTTAFSLVCHDSVEWSEIEKIILGAVPKK